MSKRIFRTTRVKERRLNEGKTLGIGYLAKGGRGKGEKGEIIKCRNLIW